MALPSRATELECLWQPIAVGPLRLANRVFVPAHGTLHDRPRYARYLAERARGGAALVVTGAIPVHPSSLLMSGWLEGWRDEHVAEYEQLARAVHDEGGRVFAQLYHAGAQDSGGAALDAWHPVLAPSAIPSPVFGRMPKAIEQHEIDELVSSFGQAAEIALSGGMDGIEVHGAHGYLIHAFLSPLTNHRTDAYGGCAENRSRFALEVGREIRRRCGGDAVIGMRLNFDDLAGPYGLTPARASETLAILDRAGLYDYVSVSAGTYHALERIVPSMSSGLYEQAVEHAAEARRIVRPATVVMVSSGIHSIDGAAVVVESGRADMVGMARAHIADPAIVKKARRGAASEIRRCVGANQSCWRRALSGQMVTCTVNPAAGRERELSDPDEPLAPNQRSLLVVGGGPAGMKAAEAAALRGFRVTLVERSNALGGALRSAARLPGRERWGDLVEDLAASLDRLAVDVRLGVEATANFVRALDVELAVLATGAIWDRGESSASRIDGSALPGAEAAHVIDPAAAVERGADCGTTVVIDELGDTIAPGVAELLAGLGCEVTLVTSAPAIGARIGPTATADLPWILPRLFEAGVALAVGCSDVSVTPAGVRVRRGASTDDLTADTVVLVSTRRSDATLYEALEGRATRIGDCLAPREVDDAIYEAARLIASLDAGGVASRMRAAPRSELHPSDGA